MEAPAHMRRYELKILFYGGGQGETCATVMLPQDD
jgi:hypothetical protein